MVADEEHGAAGRDVLDPAHFEAEVVAPHHPEEVEEETHELRVPIGGVVGREVTLSACQRVPGELLDQNRRAEQLDAIADRHEASRASEPLRRAEGGTDHVSHRGHHDSARSVPLGRRTPSHGAPIASWPVLLAVNRDGGRFEAARASQAFARRWRVAGTWAGGFRPADGCFGFVVHGSLRARHALVSEDDRVGSSSLEGANDPPAQ